MKRSASSLVLLYAFGKLQYGLVSRLLFLRRKKLISQLKSRLLTKALYRGRHCLSSADHLQQHHQRRTAKLQQLLDLTFIFPRLLLATRITKCQRHQLKKLPKLLHAISQHKFLQRFID